MCRRLKESHAAEFEASLLPFVNVLLAATDYLLFAELMLGSTDDGEARVLPILVRKVVKGTSLYVYPRAMRATAMVVAVAHGLPLVPPKRS